MVQVTNPLTGRKVELEGPTARKLLRQGTVVQAGDRLLRPAQAALEERAQALGLPRGVWRFPATVDPGTIDRVARAVAALGEAQGRRIGPDVAAARAPGVDNPLANPLADADIDALLLDLDPDKYYLLYVGGALTTWNEGDGAVALKGDQAAAHFDDLRELLEEEEGGGPVEAREVPQEAEVRDDPGFGRMVVFYSYDNSQLEHNRSRARTAVRLLRRGTRYQLFGHWGQAGEPLQAVEWHVNNHPQGFRGRAGDRTQRVHDADDVNPLVLNGVDASRWNAATQYGKAIRWELRPMPEQEADPGPFREADRDAVTGEIINCVLQRVEERFSAGAAQANHGRGHRHAGKRLARKRDHAIATWKARIAARGDAGGFTLRDIEAFEKDCEIRLLCMSATGADMTPPGLGLKRTARANRWLEVRVILHDHHGFADLPDDPPKVSAVVTFDSEAEAAFEKAREIKDSLERARAVDAAALAFYGRAIPRGKGRAWVVGSELVYTEDGKASTIYRTLRAMRQLDSAFSDITGCHPEFGDLPECLKEEYDAASNMIGGAATYRRVQWMEREGIRPTPRGGHFRDVWQKAQVEAVPWMSATDESATSQQIDMRAAYLACDRRTTRADSEAAPEIERFGFPTASMRRAALPMEQVLTTSSPVFALTGIVQLVHWEFATSVHEFTPWRLGSHLKKNDGWITTPELYDLLVTGDLVSAHAREIVYSLGRKQGLQYPDAPSCEEADWATTFVGKLGATKFERTQAVHFVGKLSRKANQTTILTHDKNEAAFLANSLEGRFQEHVAGGTADAPAYLVRYEPQRVRAQWFHIRAFVLAYTNISLRKMLRRFDGALRHRVTRVCTDAIYATEIPPSVSARLVQGTTDEKTIKWGQWRLKAPGYTWYAMREAAAYTGSLPELASTPSDAPPLARDPHNIPGVDASAVPPELTAQVLSGCSKILITGPGGCGKTYVTARALDGRDFVILCPGNDLAEEHRRKLGCRTATYHKMLGLPVGKNIATWDPEALGHKLDNLPEILVCDEGSMVPRPVWERILPYLESRGRQVIICEDDAQLSDFEKSDPAGYHKEWASATIDFTVDMRSQDDDIRSLKAAIWRTSDDNQRAIWRARVPETSLDAAIAEWHPRDIFLCSTNDMGAEIQGRLLAEHRRRYPHEPAPIRFAPDPTVEHRYRQKARENRIRVPGTERTCPTIRGHIEWVPLSAIDIDGLGPEWQYAGWGTIHCVQGKTINAPRRLYVVDHKLEGWLDNAVYTAVSRVRTFPQLRRVVPPANLLGYIQPRGVQAEPSVALIESRIRRHNLDDLSAARAGKRAAVEKAARLDADYVMDLIVRADGKCCHCGCPLLLQGFKPRHPQAFSIDRIDNARGHEVGNVAISCYSCNIRHKD